MIGKVKVKHHKNTRIIIVMKLINSEYNSPRKIIVVDNLVNVVYKSLSQLSTLFCKNK